MVAVAVGAPYAKVSDLDDLPPTLMDEIGAVFHQLQQNARPCGSSRSPGAARQRDRDFFVETRVIRPASD